MFRRGDGMNKFKIEFKWAIYYTFLVIMWFQLEKYLGFHDKNIANHPVFTNLMYVFIFGVYILFLIDKKKNFFKGIVNNIFDLIFFVKKKDIYGKKNSINRVFR